MATKGFINNVGFIIRELKNFSSKLTEKESIAKINFTKEQIIEKLVFNDKIMSNLLDYAYNEYLLKFRDKLNDTHTNYDQEWINLTKPQKHLFRDIEIYLNWGESGGNELLYKKMVNDFSMAYPNEYEKYANQVASKGKIILAAQASVKTVSREQKEDTDHELFFEYNNFNCPFSNLAGIQSGD